MKTQGAGAGLPERFFVFRRDIGKRRDLFLYGERMQGARQPEGNGIARGADIAGLG